MRSHRSYLRMAALACLVCLVRPAPSGAAGWIYGGNQVSFAAGAVHSRSVAPDGSGGVYVAWNVDSAGTPFESNLRLQRYDAIGNPVWAVGGIIVCNAPADQISPVLVPDDSGGVFVAWDDRRPPFATAAGIYAQRVQSNGIALWTTNGVRVAGPRIDFYPADLAAVTDHQTGVFLAWRDDRSSRDTTSAIWAQRLNWQGTSAWAAGGVIVGLGGAAAAGISIASDATNGLYLSWDEQYILASGDIRAQRVDFAGSPQWGSDGLVVCNVAGRQSQAAMDGWGVLGAVVTWTDERLLNPGIYAQRINVAGTPQWAANGMAVPLASSNGSPVVRTDGSQAYVSATTSPIQLEKLDSNGAQVWNIDVASIDGTAPKLVSDGAGGVNVAWNGTTGGDDDIYDRRILPSGTPAWVFAFRLTTDDVDNLFPVTTTDAAGGIYAAWSDVRTGTNQIYLSRVTVDGMVPALGVERRTPRALFLGPARPQPAHADVQVDLDLPDARQVHASVVDAAGRTVATLLDGATIAAGRHPLRWDGRDRRGTPVPPGLYFLLVRAPSERVSRRIVITR